MADKPATPRYCVLKGTAQGAEVKFDPRGVDDRFPWVVESRWRQQYNGWRYSADCVTTVERYRQLRTVPRGNARA